MNKLKKITQTAKCTSYVNKEPLSLRFPTNSIAQKDYISSIRLSKEKILNNKQFNYLNKINIIRSRIACHHCKVLYTAHVCQST